MQGDEVAIVEPATQHSHLPNPEKAEESALRARCEKRALDRPGEAASSAASSSLHDHDEDVLAQMPPEQKLKRIAWRARSKECKKQMGQDANEGQACFRTLTTLAIPPRHLAIAGKAISFFGEGSRSWGPCWGSSPRAMWFRSFNT